MYKWILLAHAIGGATLFGSHVYLESLMAGATKAPIPTYMTTMIRISKSAGRVMGPASVITLVFGIWLVIETTFGFEDVFVGIGLLAVVAAFAISMFLLDPRLKEIEAIVEESGVEDESAVAKMKSVVGLIHLLTVIVAIAFVAMIIKPGIL